MFLTFQFFCILRVKLLNSKVQVSETFNLISNQNSKYFQENFDKNSFYQQEKSTVFSKITIQKLHMYVMQLKVWMFHAALKFVKIFRISWQSADFHSFLWAVLFEYWVTGDNMLHFTITMVTFLKNFNLPASNRNKNLCHFCKF